MADWYERVPIFAGLDASALALLAKAAEVDSYRTGDILFREGDKGSEVYLIESGSVDVVEALGEPQEKVLATLEAGNFFGEMAILECGDRSAAVRVRTESVLHKLKHTDLYHLFQFSAEQYAILILNIARDLARRLHRLDEEFVYRQ